MSIASPLSRNGSVPGTVLARRPPPLIQRTLARPVLSLFLLFAAGCSGCIDGTVDETAPAENPFASQQVPVVAPAALELESRARLVLDEWGTRTGAQWRLLEYDAAAGSGPLLDLLRPNGGGPHPGARLVFFPITRTAELAHAGRLAPVPEPQRDRTALDWLDVFAGLRENVATVGGQPSLVPLSSPVLVCYYRRDLLEEAGLSPPETWEDYQHLLDSLDQWAGGRTAVEPWGEEDRATMFLARAAGFAKHPGQLSLFFGVGDGEPLIDSPGFVRGLEAARAALDRMSAAVAGYSSADCRREFLAGRAALAIAFEGGPDGAPASRRTDFQSVQTSDVGESVEVHAGADAAGSDGLEIGPATGEARPEGMHVGVCRLPGAMSVYNPSTEAWESAPDGRVNRVTLTAFAGLAAGVSPGSGAAAHTAEQAAWNLLHTLAVEEAAAVFPSSARGMCRNSQAAQPDRWAGRDLASDEARAWSEAVAESLRDPRLVAELPVVGRDRFRRALTEGLEPVLSGTAAPEEALRAVAEAWREIADDVGIENVRDSYRRSLGLSVRARSVPIGGTRQRP